MTHAEFRAIRQSLGLSQTGLAEAIHRRCPGTPSSSIVRRVWAWEKGEAPIAWYGAALIRLLAEGRKAGE